MAEESSGDDFTTTTWWSHCTDHCAIDDVPYSPVLMIIPPSLIKVLPNQFNRRLTPISVILWHVQVINEQDTFLSERGAIVAFSSLYKFIINDELGLHRSGLRRKADEY